MRVIVVESSSKTEAKSLEYGTDTRRYEIGAVAFAVDALVSIPNRSMPVQNVALAALAALFAEMAGCAGVAGVAAGRRGAGVTWGTAGAGDVSNSAAK